MKATQIVPRFRDWKPSAQGHYSVSRGLIIRGEFREYCCRLFSIIQALNLINITFFILFLFLKKPNLLHLKKSFDFNISNKNVMYNYLRNRKFPIKLHEIVACQNDLRNNKKVTFPLILLLMLPDQWDQRTCCQTWQAQEGTGTFPSAIASVKIRWQKNSFHIFDSCIERTWLS